MHALVRSLAAACLTTLAVAAPAAAAPMADGGKETCVYAAHRVSTLARFSALVQRPIDCALVYNDASPGWEGWEKPWFTVHNDPDLNWAKWVRAAPDKRRLIITQNLFPASENGADWRRAGARGDYDEHARALARNLIAAGLGDAVIRLGHEANGDWYPDSIGSTAEQYSLWATFWRRTVLAMKSVPGANFKFDWTVNAAYRPIPLADWYPGDDVVDFVGVDAYDSGIANVMDGATRWTTVFGRRLGLGDVLAFAKAHGKPLSIPEWGVAPPTTALSGGDNGAYVDGIAGVVRENQVAYQSYFFNREWADQLASGPLSLAAYRCNFAVAAPAEEGQPAAVEGSAPTAPGGASTNPVAPAGTVTPVDRRAKVTARALARAAAKRIRGRRVRRGRTRTVRVSIRSKLPGTACIVVATRSKRTRTIRCGGRAVEVAAGTTIARGAGTVGARSRNGLEIRVRARGARRLRRHHGRVAIVSVFTPAGGGAVLARR